MTTNDSVPVSSQVATVQPLVSAVHEHAIDLARHRRAITKRLRRKQTDMRLEALAGLDDGNRPLNDPTPAG